jgi:hypothetical protein
VLSLAGLLAGAATLGYALRGREAATASCALVLTANAAVAALAPAILALTSTLVPHESLGKLFAAANVCQAAGRVGAGLLGAPAYEYSLGVGEALPPLLAPLLGGGALPVAILGPLMAAAAAALFCTTRAAAGPWAGPAGAAGAAGGAAEGQGKRGVGLL